MVSVFWNVNALAELAVVRDGVIRVVLSDLVCLVGEDAATIRGMVDHPEDVEELAVGLSEAGELDWESVVFSWVARWTGVGLPGREWFSEGHPSVVMSG